MKNDLKVEMAPAGSPDERLDRTISYVNGSLSNAELVTLAQQFVSLTTNTYLGGEKIERTDISQPDGGASKQIATLALTDRQTINPDQHDPDAGPPTITGTVSYDGDGVLYTTQTNDSVANGATLSFTSSGSRFYYVLYANETANYSAAVLEY